MAMTLSWSEDIWTSLAHLSDWCLLLVRPMPMFRSTRGITALLVDI
jgi:alkylation response protein AidB-like acyl-CoA dehydrogenase